MADETKKVSIEEEHYENSVAVNLQRYQFKKV